MNKVADPTRVASLSDQPETISVEDAGKLLMIEPRSVRRLASAGHFRPAVKGRYALIDLVQGYILHLTAERKGASESAAANRVRDARARDFEVRTAKAARELITMAEAEATQDEIIQDLRSGFNTVSAEITRDLEQRRKIDEAINGVLSRVCRKLSKKAEVARAGGGASTADAPSKSGRVGTAKRRLPAKRGRPRAT